MQDPYVIQLKDSKTRNSLRV